MKKRFGPLWFALTGLAWIVVMAMAGMALYVGTVRSTPLAPTLRVVHAHGALIGGVLQILVGAWLARRRALGHPHGGYVLSYLAINLGTAGLAAGIWLHLYVVAGFAGIVALAPLLPLCGDLFTAYKKDGLFAGLWPSWLGALIATAFLVGSGLGIGSALGLVPTDWIIHTRLAHVHVLLLGVLVLVGLVLLRPLLAAACGSRPATGGLAAIAQLGIVAGIIGLLTGFLIGHLTTQIAAGALLLTALFAYGATLLQMWLSASARPAGADALLVGFLFLLLGTTMGLLVAINFLYEPHPFPFGTLHLVAYTHLTFVGFVLALLFGGFATWLPQDLAEERVPSHKKRPAYAARLGTSMSRWSGIQLGALVLGTMGLAAVATLTWQNPMSAAIVQQTMWASLLLILVSLTIFAVQITATLGRRPDDQEPTA